MPEVAGVWLRVRSRATFVHAPLLWANLDDFVRRQYTKTGHQMGPTIRPKRSVAKRLAGLP